MSETKNLEDLFEKNLDALGKQLEGTLEEWREAEVEKRSELEEQIRSLETNIEEMKSNLEEERRAHLPGVEVAKEGEREAFSLARACRAIGARDFSNAPYEQEVFANMSEKAMSQGIDSAGGYIVPEEAITRVIERLKAEVIAYKLGAVDMAASGSPISVPRLSASATAYWVSENSTITPSDLTFQQVSMTPKTAACRVVLSNLLLETSMPTADAVIEQDIASQLGIALDTGILNGSGASGEPLGVMNETGIGSVASVGTAASAPVGDKITSLAKLTDFIDSLANNNALSGSLGWAIHPAILSYIRQMTSVAGGSGATDFVAINTQVVAEGPAYSILGYPYYTSTSMGTPSGATVSESMCFGNWNDLMVARWGGLRLAASTDGDNAFSLDQTHIRATVRADVAVRHAASFCKSA
jgi:HK97 family phage major capsid protein